MIEISAFGKANPFNQSTKKSTSCLTSSKQLATRLAAAVAQPTKKTPSLFQSTLSFRFGFVVVVFLIAINQVK